MKAQASYRGLVESTRDWIWEMDLDGKHTYSNHRLEAILGYSLEEFPQLALEELLHPEDAKAFSELVPKLIAEKRGWHGWVVRFRHKEGGYRYLESNAEPILDAEGAVRGFRGVDRDVSERKRVELALRESEETFATVFRASPIPMSLSELPDGESRGRFVEVNASFEAVSGYARAEIVGRTTLELGLWPHPADRERAVDLLKREGKLRDVEIRFRVKSGDVRLCRYSGDIVQIRGKPHILAAVADITELRRAEQALAAQARLDELIAEISAALLQAPASEVDRQVELALQQIGELLSLDRIALWWFDDQKEKARATHSWVRPGIPALPTAVDLSRIPWILAHLLDGKCVRFSRPDELPVDASLDRQLVAAVGVKSYLVTPLTVAGSRAGGCTFSTTFEEVEWPSELVAKLTILSQIMASSVARKQADEALRQRLELEQLVAEISATFAGLPGSEIDQQIDLALRQLGEFLEVDRIALRQLSTDEAVWRLTNVWFREGSVAPLVDMSKNTSPLLEGAALRGEVFRFSSVEELPVLSVERELALSMGVQSLLALPLRMGDAVVGHFAIGTDRMERTWPDYLVPPLRIVGELFASVLARKRSEDELRASREQLRALASELVSLEERERRQIAIYLHDQIAQTLAVSRMKLGGLGTIVESVDARQTVEEIRDLLQEAIDDTQELTFDVSPPILYELGLAPAIEWIGEKLAGQHGLQLEFTDDTRSSELDPNLSAILFRATRELLMNVVKHAEAEHVTVSLASEEGALHVEVEDDGIGFDVSILDPLRGTVSFGLSSVRERMGFAGGRLEVDSRLGGGTRIRLIAPLSDDL